MTAEKAGLLRNTWKTKCGDQACLHSRVVERLEPRIRRNAQLVVCRECGAIIPDPCQQSAMDLVALHA